MSKWVQLPVPPICERMIGFSVPIDDTVLVVAYDGMYLVRLGPPVSVEADLDHWEYDLYDPDTGISRYQGKDWEIFGLYPGRPILTGRNGERIVLDAETGVLTVLDGDEIWSTPFENFSGDWAAATFSPDGQFIVLGCPYDFDFRVFARLAGV